MDCEKLNKRDFNLLYSQGFFAFLNLAYDREVLSPDLFSHGSRSSTNRSDLLNSLVSDTHNTCFVYTKASLEVAKHEVQSQLDGRTLAMDNTGIILSSLVSLSQSKVSKEAGFTAITISARVHKIVKHADDVNKLRHFAGPVVTSERLSKRSFKPPTETGREHVACH